MNDAIRNEIVRRLAAVRPSPKSELNFNSPFELSYWHFALSVAQQWRERQGLQRNPQWDELLDKLSPLAHQDGLYLAAETATDTYKDIRFTSDHMAVLGALAGALVVMGLILFLSTLIRSNVMLLIAGIMVGYIVSSAISLLNFFATAEGVHSYMIWGMGNFGGVPSAQLPWFSAVVAGGLLWAVLLVKPLNALLLGERYAENLGVNVRWVRGQLLGVTGLLTAVVTAFCGPVAFIGLAVPHVARLLLGTSNHNALLPVTMLCGAAVALLCNLLCILPGEWGMIPLNAVTPVLGAPVIVYVIVRQRRIKYFN